MITMWYLQSHRTWDRFCHSCIGSSSSPLGPSRRTSLCRWRRRCTPDRSKLFGSHGQRPWLHNVVIFGLGLEGVVPVAGAGLDHLGALGDDHRGAEAVLQAVDPGAFLAVGGLRPRALECVPAVGFFAGFADDHGGLVAVRLS